jgi:hypothetical protein
MRWVGISIVVPPGHSQHAHPNVGRNQGAHKMSNLLHGPADMTEVALRRHDLECYDRLPKTLRRALDEADYKFRASIYYRAWRGGTSCVELIRDAKFWNDREVERRDALKAKGQIPND